MHKPLHSFIFGCSLFLALGLLSFTFPEKGIRLTSDLQLKFPALKSILNSGTSKKDIASILTTINAVDTNFTIDESPSSTTVIPGEKSDTNSNNSDPKNDYKSKKPLKTKVLILDIQAKNTSALKNFFEALHALKTNPKSIRVLHYGDSQIEGDRITDYLRLKLQGQFGGQGAGLTPFMPITSSVIYRINCAPGWDRYNVFTVKDRRVNHGNFGVLGDFSRFVGYRKLSDTSSVLTSTVSITATKLGGSNAMNYKKLKLFYGGAQRKTWCEFYDGPALIAADSLEAGDNFRVKEYNVGRGSNTHSFKFKGKDSPDFYGLSLESDNGVMVDNIAMRGSSGTFFHQINAGQMKMFYDYLNVKLIILQFGGNSLPAIKNSEMAVNYGNYIRYQLSIVKKIAPNASILFIGPSDMSIKEGTEYITYPYLEEMRDAIKKAVIESDCAFFDMYDCMGGKNSMPSWVDQKLAATDYTHFSPQGARKIATLLYSAIIKDYNTYLKLNH